jgi:hypothetical protein
MSIVGSGEKSVKAPQANERVLAFCNFLGYFRHIDWENADLGLVPESLDPLGSRLAVYLSRISVS